MMYRPPRIELTADLMESAQLPGDTPRALSLRAMSFAHFRDWDRIHLEVVRIVTPDTPKLEQRMCAYRPCGNRIHPARLLALPETTLCDHHAALIGQAPLLAGAKL